MSMDSEERVTVERCPDCGFDNPALNPQLCMDPFHSTPDPVDEGERERLGLSNAKTIAHGAVSNARLRLADTDKRIEDLAAAYERSLAASHQRIETLERALAEVAVGLEVLVGSDAEKPIKEIAPDLREQLRSSLLNLRQVLLAPNAGTDDGN